MNISAIQNPNDPTYWKQVKEAALLRNAISAFRNESSKVHTGQIYEAWVGRLAQIIAAIAKRYNLSQGSTLEKFKTECAAMMKLPELVEEPLIDLVIEGDNAKRETARHLYGDTF